MDIKELDKKQLVLLTLLITFVVSIATGIVTVSLMSQAPKSVPQTINNVIQRTIEKVSTVETPAKTDNKSDNNSASGLVLGNTDVLIPIFPLSDNVIDPAAGSAEIKELGQGVLISDIGLLLVDNNILTEAVKYKVVLGKTNFEADVLKKFNNGFTILKISEKKTEVKPSETKPSEASTSTNQTKTN